MIIGATPARDEPANWGGDNIWVTIRDLNGGVINDSREHITDLGVRSSPSKLIKAGTLLFSFKLSIGKLGVAGRDLYTNEAIAALRVRPGVAVDCDYLRYALQDSNGASDAVHAVKGVLLNSSKIRALSVPFAPLSEQRRIVAILDQADALRRTRAEADAKAQRIVPALFLKMFGDPATNPKGWQMATLADAVRFVGGGTPARARPEYYTGKIPWATSKDMKVEYLDDTQEHVTERAIAESATNLVPAGTILIVVKSKILAHTLPLAIATRPVCFGQDLKGMICNEGYLPEFVRWSIAQQAKGILTKARGINSEGLTLDILRHVPITQPPLSRQQEFERQVQTVREVRERQKRATATAAMLFETLLAKAFSGELTAKWRAAHLPELLAELEQQMKALDSSAPVQLAWQGE